MSDAERAPDRSAAETTGTPGTGRPRAWRLWQQLPLVIVLVPLWMLLWGSVSWLSLLTGIVVALAVSLVFYLPPVELSGRVNPLWALVFLARFAGELIAASCQVAWLAFRPRPLSGSAIVAAPLATRSDFVMTLTAVAVSLVPGSIIIDVDRERSILYIHAIGIDDEAGARRVREHARSIERGIVRAVGSREDLEAIR